MQINIVIMLVTYLFIFGVKHANKIIVSTTASDGSDTLFFIADFNWF